MLIMNDLNGHDQNDLNDTPNLFVRYNPLIFQIIMYFFMSEPKIDQLSSEFSV